jgi:hypothetical protein
MPRGPFRPVLLVAVAVLATAGPKAPHPAVLLLHGFASSRDEVGGMDRRLARDLLTEDQTLAETVLRLTDDWFRDGL